MDFTWTPEQDAYRMDVRRWLEANRPQALARGDDPEAGGDDAVWERLKAWHKKLYRAGYFSAGARASQPADGMQRARRDHDWSGPDAMGDRRAEKALPGTDPR